MYMAMVDKILKLCTLKNFLMIGTGLISLHLFIVFGPMSKPTVSPEFQEHYQSFLKEAAKHNKTFVSKVNITIKFYSKEDMKELNLGPGNLGFCRMNPLSTPIIEINEVAWNKYQNNSYREMIMFHELSHCLLFKGHTHGFEKNGLPKSLMGPSMFSVAFYSNNREKFLDEVFSYKAYHIKDHIDTFYVESFKENVESLKNKALVYKNKVIALTQ